VVQQNNPRKKKKERTKLHYDMTALQWHRREHKNTAAEQVGLAAVSAAEDTAQPLPRTHPCYLRHPGESCHQASSLSRDSTRIWAQQQEGQCTLSESEKHLEKFSA